MSILAGHDLVLEISTAAVLAGVKATATIAGARLNPPFELPFVVPADQGGGTAHFIVERIELDLLEGNLARLGLSFAGSTLEVGPVRANRLEGSVTVIATLALVPDSGNASSRQIQVGFGGASVRVRFGDASRRALETTGGLTAAGVEAILAGTLAGRLVAAPPPSLPVPITVDPAATSSLTGPTVRTLVLQTIPNAERERQALGFFATMLPTTTGAAPLNRTESAIPGGRDFAMSVSFPAFHALVFAPAVRARFGVTRDEDLPASVGRAPSIRHPELTHIDVTEVSCRFEDGHVALQFRAEERGEGHTRFVRIEGRLTLALAGSSIRPVWRTEAVHIDTAYAWWMVVGAVLIGPGAVYGLVAVAALAYQLGRDGVAGLVPPIPAVTPDLANATPTEVTVLPDRMTVAGRLAAAVVAPARVRVRVDDRPGVETVMDVGGETGVLRSWGCPTGDYPWRVTTQQQRATYEAAPILLARPVTYEWQIGTWTWWSPLNGVSGMATLAAECHYALPAPGGVTVTQDAHVAWRTELDGRRLVLHNLPVDGNYLINVRVLATGADGQVATDTTEVRFEGDKLQVLGGYATDLDQCAREVMRQLDSERTLFAPLPRGGPRWLGFDDPRPDDLVRIATEIAALGPVGDVLLAQATAVHGDVLRHVLEGSSRDTGSGGLEATH